MDTLFRKLRFLPLVLLILITSASAALSQRSESVESLIAAQFCIDAVSSQVFFDGAPADHAVTVALVQCGEQISEYVNSLIEDLVAETQTELEQRQASQISAKTVFELYTRQLNLLTGQTETN